jgi:hypothetical protein
MNKQTEIKKLKAEILFRKKRLRELGVNIH